MTVSRWTHAICVACWNAQRPDAPVSAEQLATLVEHDEPCCYCGKKPTQGIYLRQDPTTVRCEGKH